VSFEIPEDFRANWPAEGRLMPSGVTTLTVSEDCDRFCIGLEVRRAVECDVCSLSGSMELDRAMETADGRRPGLATVAPSKGSMFDCAAAEIIRPEATSFDPF
jgi:hypothetical protein